MITLRIPRAFSLNLRWICNPILWVVFLYFATSSMDLLNIPLIVYKVKLSNFTALILLLFHFLSFRSLWLDRRLFALTSLLLASMTISALQSKIPAYCFGIIVFFSFNYLTYFLVSYNLFRKFPPALLLKIYSASFYLIGCYACCQVLFSLAGIIIPGVGQYIFNIARGQAFSYEPSYYALYMTPFVFYQTTKYILSQPTNRKWNEVFWPNFFLLVSTSTGCFFSYLFFLFVFFLFQQFSIVDFRPISLKQLIRKWLTASLILFSFLWIINKNLITKGLLKFFYGRDLFSLTERWDGIVNYWNIFLSHPIFGVGFGCGPFHIAQKKGKAIGDYFDPAFIAAYNPTNVTTEVLAGLGIVGGALFLGFFFFLIQSFRSSLKLPLSEEERIALIALALSVCVMFMTLQMNQSIMRSYMWIHVGVFCGYARHLQQKYITA